MRTISISATALFLIFIAIEAEAISLPKWFSVPASEDAYFYYGYGMGESPSEAQAMKAAAEESLSDLIKTNLGFDFQEKTEYFSDLETVHLKRDSSQSTSQIKLADIKISRIERMEKRNGYIIYVIQRSIPKAYIMKIRKELDSTENAGQKLLKITVSSNPAGADIDIDGRSLGLTPINAFLPPGKHRLKLKKDGFSIEERIIYLDQQTDYSLDVPLKPSRGELSLKISPSNAMISINDEMSFGNNLSHSLPPGTYTIRISKDGFVPVEKLVAVVQGRASVVEINLTEKSAPLQFKAPHKIRIPMSIAIDQEAEFYINAKKYNDHQQYDKLQKLMTDNFQPTFKKTALYYYYSGIAKIENGLPLEGLEDLKTSSEDENNSSVQSKICKAYYLSKNYSQAINYCSRDIIVGATTEALLYKTRSFFALAKESRCCSETYTELAVNTAKELIKLDRKWEGELDVCYGFPFNTTQACRTR